MSTPKPPTILVIMGSVRAGRRCPQIAEWVLSLADKSDHLAYEIVDLQEWHLPFDDEPSIPAKGAYTHDHTRAWSTKVASADGFVIVSPQYNWGYPAALKNALDHLYNEWSRKPLVIVTHGGHGGDKCAEQLRQVAGGLKLRPVDTMPAITVARDSIENDVPQSLEELKPLGLSIGPRSTRGRIPKSMPQSKRPGARKLSAPALR